MNTQIIETNKIIQGDCIEEMKKLPDNSVDAIITDPPYGLEFMGKDWDKFGISEGGAKRLTGIDNKGSGDRFFDYREGASEMGIYSEMTIKEKTSMQMFMYSWAREALRVLKPGGYILSFGGTRTYHRMTCGIEDAGFEIRDCIMWLYGSGFPKSLNIGKQIDKIQGNEREIIGKESIGTYKSISKIRVEQGYRENLTKSSNKIDITKGSSEWEGWGTALKPAVEPIVVARKPLSEKNVALNVLKWGTGGINIDECRIECNPILDKSQDRTMIQKADGFEKGWGMKPQGKVQVVDLENGRFPANIILDEEAGQMLGEPSRFFYCAKASKVERNFGCEELPNVRAGGMQGRNDGSFDGNITYNNNNHPTVKPVKLIEYLIKLVSRENSIVLDPFLGSGTTAIACLKLNRNFIGIEKEPEYIKIAEARIKPFLEQRKL